MCASCLTVDMCSWFNPVVINNGRRSKRDGADDVRVRDSFLRRRAHLYRRPGNVRSCTQHLYEFLCTLICPTPDADLQLSSSSPSYHQHHHHPCHLLATTAPTLCPKKLSRFLYNFHNSVILLLPQPESLGAFIST